MKRIPFGNRLTPGLLTACVLFGVIVALEWLVLSRQEGTDTGSDAQPAVSAEVQLTRATYMAPDFEAFSEILERPLFTEGRTPPPEPTAEQAAVSPGKKQTQLMMRLEGIALTPLDRIVVVRDTTSNKLLRLAEGATHQGWVVESIHATGATLKRGEQTHELTLELNTKKIGKKPRSGMKIPKKKK